MHHENIHTYRYKKFFFITKSCDWIKKKNEEKKVPLGGFLSLYPHELKRVFKLMFKI